MPFPSLTFRPQKSFSELNDREVLALAIAVSRRWRLLVAIKPRPMLAA